MPARLTESASDSWGGVRKRLSSTQMVLLTHLAAGFEKGPTGVVIAMVTALRYSGLCKDAPSAYSFQGMRNESNLPLLVA